MIDPITKEEFYLDFMVDGGDITKLPEPMSRGEKFLYALCQNRRFLKLRKGETNIEASYDNGTTWSALISIADLQAAPELRKGTTNIEASYDNGTTWTALIAIADLQAAPATAVADSEAADVAGVVADLNELLASLRAAGVLATA